jgi:predicted metal-dependent hydrolase
MRQSRGPLMGHDPRYLKGIEHFNRREFFDAHEIWEELWHEEHGSGHNFVQGLIQFATSLHHFEAHNLKGAKLLYEGGVELLTPYGDVFWNLPVKKLINQMTECVKGMLPYKQEELPGRYHPGKETFPVQINDALIPKIELE